MEKVGRNGRSIVLLFIEFFSLTHFCWNLIFKVLAYRLFVKAMFFFVSKIYCRSVKLLNSNGYLIKETLTKLDFRDMDNRFFFCILYYCLRQSGFIVLYVWEIVTRKNLTIFEGCHFSRFYIIDLVDFCENRDKKYQFGPILFQSR